MFKLTHVAPEDATGEVRKAYDLFPPAIGVPLPAQLFSASPFLLGSQIASMRNLMGNERMEPALLAAVRFMAASAYGYAFCIRLNGDMLRRGGMDQAQLDALADGDLAGLPFEARELAMLGLVRKVVLDPASVTDEDVQACRDAGWQDSDILEISALAGFMQVSGRLMAAFGPRE